MAEVILAMCRVLHLRPFKLAAAAAVTVNIHRVNTQVMRNFRECLPAAFFANTCNEIHPGFIPFAKSSMVVVSSTDGDSDHLTEGGTWHVRIYASGIKEYCLTSLITTRGRGISPNNPVHSIRRLWTISLSTIKTCLKSIYLM
jgi:hypothetical protein